MAKIKPFRAVIYNQEKFKDISSLVCPPYDIISATQQQYYRHLNPYNLIHVLLGKDVPGENKYRRAARYFRDWLKSGILVQEEKPQIYFYSQEYRLQGEKRSRLGFIALLHLGDKDSSIFSHEHTHLEPREDRLRLLRAVKANLSPIFVIFSDRKRIIQRIYQIHLQGQNPFIDIVDDGIAHKVWAISDPDILRKIVCGMQEANIFIADGHHRYEVACAYQQQMKKKSPGIASAEEGLNYLLAYFTNADSLSLTVLPIHRLVKVGSAFNLDAFKARLQEYFDVEEVKDKTRLFFLMAKAAPAEHVLGMYKDKLCWLLRLKSVKILDKLISDKPREYRTLDVSILNYLLLKGILGLDWQNKERITFGNSADELMQEVDNDDSLCAFFLNPAKVGQIMSLAMQGEKMPPKSTYFYPKVLSGLVINKL